MITLETIFEKKVEDITPQEEDYLKEKESLLADEQKEKFAPCLHNAEQRITEKENKSEEKEEEKEETRIETKQVSVNDLVVAITKIKEIVNKII